MRLLDQLNPKIKGNAGEFLHLRHPGTRAPLYQLDADGKPTDRAVGIWLYGRDSDQWEASQQRKVERQAKQKTPLTSADLARLMVEQLADVTKAFENIDDYPDFSVANAIDLYTRLVWVKEQVQEFLEDRSNFL